MATDTAQDFDFATSNQGAISRLSAMAGAVMSGGCELTVIPAGTTDVAVVAATPGLRLMGYFTRETGAAAVASVLIHHGDANGDPLIHASALAISGMATYTAPEGGVSCPDGIWLERTGAGTPEVCVLTKVAP